MSGWPSGVRGGVQFLPAAIFAPPVPPCPAMRPARSDTTAIAASRGMIEASRRQCMVSASLCDVFPGLLLLQFVVHRWDAAFDPGRISSIALVLVSRCCARETAMFSETADEQRAKNDDSNHRLPLLFEEPLKTSP